MGLAKVARAPIVTLTMCVCAHSTCAAHAAHAAYAGEEWHHLPQTASNN